MTAVTNWPSISMRSGLGMVARMIRRVGLLVDLRIGEVPDAALRIFLAVGQAHADLDLGEAAVLLRAAPRGSSSSSRTLTGNST